MSTPAYTAFVGGVAGQAHNEAAFRHFLNIERRRAERASRSVLLVLIGMRAGPGRTRKLHAIEARVLFSVLGATVREADFVGWYREDRVAAAAMTHHPAPDDIRARVNDRVVSELRTQLRDAHLTCRVRVVRLGGKVGA